MSHIIESIKLPIFKADSLPPFTKDIVMLGPDNFSIHMTRKWCR